MKKLFCFDFDNTLVKGHVHSQLTNKGIVPVTNNNTLVINGIVQTGEINPKYDKKLVKHEASKLLKNPDIGLRDKQALKKTFVTILEQGHQIAITSFTKYPDAISAALEELGLTQIQLEGIKIIGGFPKGGARDPNAKTEHIEKAMELSGIKDKQNVVLIDDSIKNINNAKEQGISAVLVKDGFKWDNITKLIGSKQINTTQEKVSNIANPKNVNTKDTKATIKETQKTVRLIPSEQEINKADIIKGKVVSATARNDVRFKDTKVVIGKKQGWQKFLATIFFLKKEKVIGLIDKKSNFIQDANIIKNFKKEHKIINHGQFANTEIDLIVSKEKQVIAVRNAEGLHNHYGERLHRDKIIERGTEITKKSILKNSSSVPPIPEKSEEIRQKYKLSDSKAARILQTLQQTTPRSKAPAIPPKSLTVRTKYQQQSTRGI
ncbi:hypothetical protein [Rickettsia sp. TH2014]|uniref:hypothetical protein n=1 Tax=Rickettsia sp. TH2014 TaxID=1967503 RepID=UPI001C481793|nr:hypothetical protein [Rickettsia sp. TH2014]